MRFISENSDVDTFGKFSRSYAYPEGASSRTSRLNFTAPVTFEVRVTEWNNADLYIGFERLGQSGDDISAAYVNLNTLEVAATFGDHIHYVRAQRERDDSVTVRMTCGGQSGRISVRLGILRDMTYSFEADGTESITVSKKWTRFITRNYHHPGHLSICTFYDTRSDSWFGEPEYRGGSLISHDRYLSVREYDSKPWRQEDTPGVTLYSTQERLSFDRSYLFFTGSHYSSDAASSNISAFLSESSDSLRVSHTSSAGSVIDLTHPTAIPSGVSTVRLTLDEDSVSIFDSETETLVSGSSPEVSSSFIGFYSWFGNGALATRATSTLSYKSIIMIMSAVEHDSLYDRRVRQHMKKMYDVFITSAPTEPITESGLLDISVKTYEGARWTLTLNGHYMTGSVGTGAEQVLSGLTIPPSSLSPDRNTAVIELSCGLASDVIRVKCVPGV